ncbi:MAG: ATP-binding cassette domain-containing protein [Candidatus Freyarchaeum deiterrae]
MNGNSITIIGGFGRDGTKENVDRVELKMGNIVSIVGPTGCGKTTLIKDIEMFANLNTPSRRKILIDGETQSDDGIFDPSKNPIALITQHTNFLSDLPVDEFLNTHATIRQSGDDIEKVIQETLEFANLLTGEPVIQSSAMTELSGGQTRALLIADAVIIGNAPIVLLDEIENAGIHRTKALELLRKYRKLFVFVTHDPRIALLSDFRIVMKGGAMQKVIYTDDEEKKAAEKIKKLDDIYAECRRKIRLGEVISEKDIILNGGI